eukprot:PITA_09982
MKGIHPSVGTHHIYIKEECKPVRQPQRRMNPALQDIVKEEVQKLLDAGFIYPISDSEWVSPLVLMPKKNGKWRICVDYRELNKATKKDHFPLPFIDQVLDGLAGKSFFSFLDGFSGYNQIQISLEDQDKTTFTCPWDTFAYPVLRFRLCNAPATFQRAVLSILAELVHDSVEIYMDDFTPYGSSFQEALSNLGKVLSKCIEMNLSLSLEKCEFLMTEGTVLGHTISRQGLQVDPNKVAIIKRVPPPQKVRDVWSFLGLAGHYRRFIKDFSKLASPLFGLLAKDVEFKWSDDCQKALNELKDKLVSAPILRGPNWAVPFHIHTDASNKAIGATLGQLEEKLPYAIYFVSKNLSKAEMNNTVTEKEFLAVVHALNKFQHYIIGYQTFVYTDHAAIRYLMNKPDVNARIIRWLLLLQQFDLTIVDKPGRENLVADFLSRLYLPAGEEGTMDDQMPDEHLFSIFVLSLWFADIANYLVSSQFPLHLSSKEKSRIVRKSESFTWIGGNLFKLGPDHILRRCAREEEVFDILLTCHDGPCGGHFAAKRTAFKILQAGYYWPTLHAYVRRYISQCDRCQRMGKPTPRDEMPLQPQVTLESFEKWETKAIKAAIEEKVAEFLRENIFYKFGYPREIVTNKGIQFTSNFIEYLLAHHRIKHRTSTPYHPQANGQVEVTNRALEGILTKVVSSSRKDWADHLVEATWAYNTTWKTTTSFTPYELFYGKRALLSIEFEYNTLRMAAQLDVDLSHAQQERLM